MYVRSIISDIERTYPSKTFIAALPKAVFNASIHASFLIRCFQYCPTWMRWLFRRLLISHHSIDIGPGVEVGLGLILPHPLNIVIGSGARVDHSVTIYHGVTLGQAWESYPVIGANVTIYPNASLIGDVKIKAGTRIPAGSRIIGRPRERAITITSET